MPATRTPLPTPTGSPQASPAATPDQQLGELLAAAAAGDAAAYDAVYAQLLPRVRGLAARILRDHHLADEVAQEVFAEVWRTCQGFDAAKGSAAGWVLMLTHRRAVDRVRHEDARRRRDESYGLKACEVPFDQTASVSLDRAEASTVRRAVTTLSAVQRQAIELVYYRGLTHSQAAHFLQVPLGTVKARVRDGLIRMRSLPELALEAA